MKLIRRIEYKIAKRIYEISLELEKNKTPEGLDQRMDKLVLLSRQVELIRTLKFIDSEINKEINKDEK